MERLEDTFAIDRDNLTILVTKVTKEVPEALKGHLANKFNCVL
ncbi:MAG: hypothetical protein ABS938_03510 [Psychrobacillus psychrodurans]